MHEACVSLQRMNTAKLERLIELSISGSDEAEFRELGSELALDHDDAVRRKRDPAVISSEIATALTAACTAVLPARLRNRIRFELFNDRMVGRWNWTVELGRRHPRS